MEIWQPRCEGKRAHRKAPAQGLSGPSKWGRQGRAKPRIGSSLLRETRQLTEDKHPTGAKHPTETVTGRDDAGLAVALASVQATQTDRDMADDQPVRSGKTCCEIGQAKERENARQPGTKKPRHVCRGLSRSRGVRRPISHGPQPAGRPSGLASGGPWPSARQRRRAALRTCW